MARTAIRRPQQPKIGHFGVVLDANGGKRFHKRNRRDSRGKYRVSDHDFGFTPLQWEWFRAIHISWA